MKFTSLALLLALSSVSGFLPSAHHHHNKRAIIVKTPLASTSSLLSSTDSDVSIPYDAAARLAYDAWRKEFNKGDFNAKRYEQFKSNYEALTAANMSAKKQARDQGTGTVDLLTLNEYGDFSAEEYEAMLAGGDVKSSGTDIMGKAMEAVESQAEASNALAEASEALAEEEEVRLGKLAGRQFSAGFIYY
jgi:hypothetical protein